MRFAARTDSIHAEIVAALRQTGALVLDLSRVGHGCPDLLVARAGQVFLIECKDVHGALTSEQVAFQGLGWPVAICRTAEEALEAIGAL